MKIILLRHEERNDDISFYSKLTDNGINNSILLINKIKDLNIDVIFSSPFIRTLETIYFYCIKYNKKVNIDYGLYEYLHNSYFSINKWYYTKDEINNANLINIINNNYSSIINIDDFNILENEINLENRIIKLFNYILSEYKNKTILIISHMAVINKIKDLYIKKTELNELFSMGHYEIYDI